MRIRHPSLLWRVLLVTSFATVALFCATAYVLTSYAIGVTEQSVEDEVQASLREVEVLWRARAESLSRASQLLSNMSDVRGAFMTGDAATIRDTAADLWSRVSPQQGVFLVFDPLGREIASLSGATGEFDAIGSFVPGAARRFPEQVSGFFREGKRLYYAVL